jgi:hypothetical protein
MASAFLFLTGKYAKAQKLTPQFLDVSLNLAVQALSGEKTQRMAASSLLALAKYSGRQITRLPVGLVDIVGRAPLPPDVFGSVVEATARIFDAQGRLAMVTDALVERWRAAQENEPTLETAHELRTVLCGFVGVARVHANSRLFADLCPHCAPITEAFAVQIQRICAEFGGHASRREDLREMLAFLAAETVLFTELVFRDCGYVFRLYAELRADLRPPEVLKLAEVIFKSEIPPEIVRGLHETVVEPTEEMLTGVSDDYSEHAEGLARVLHALARNYFEAVQPGDITFLLKSLSQTNHTVVLETIKAIDACVEKADLRLMEREREGFFREFLFGFIVELLWALCSGSHQFCYREVISLLRKLFDLIGSGKIRCQLFEGEETNARAAEFLSRASVEPFPLVTPNEVVDLFELLLMPRTEASFEELIAQFIARAKQTTPGETLRHLSKQKMKEIIAD